MILSVKHRIVFVHVGKNGGNAISRALQGVATPGYWNGDGQHKHWPANRIASELLLGTWKRYVSFGVVSNPWRWLHANYHYHIMTASLYSPELLHPKLEEWRAYTMQQPVGHAAVWINQTRRTAKLTFREFVMEVCSDFDATSPGGQLSRWLQDESGRNLVGHVLMYEQLAQSFDAFCSEAGVPAAPLERSNPTIMRDGRPRWEVDYRDEYDVAMVARVQATFRRDIELFEYEF